MHGREAHPFEHNRVQFPQKNGAHTRSTAPSHSEEPTSLLHLARYLERNGRIGGTIQINVRRWFPVKG
jgi:hypothetical protein